MVFSFNVYWDILESKCFKTLFRVFKNTDRLAHKFNERANTEGFNLKMVRNDFNDWHLQTCIFHHCACSDLLDDPGRIFNATPSLISENESVWYFTLLALRHKRIYRLGYDGHLTSCTKTDDCACLTMRKNLEHFFNVPPEDRFQLPTWTEIGELEKEWADDDIKKFNIICQILGKALKFVKTESYGNHLNKCGYEGYCICNDALNYPTNYFICEFDVNGKCQIRDESVWHFKKCACLNMLRNPYKKFPKYFKCNCNNVKI